MASGGVGGFSAVPETSLYYFGGLGLGIIRPIQSIAVARSLAG